MNDCHVYVLKLLKKFKIQKIMLHISPNFYKFIVVCYILKLFRKLCSTARIFYLQFNFFELGAHYIWENMMNHGHGFYNWTLNLLSHA
jgi:hypothetical protein